MSSRSPRDAGEGPPAASPAPADRLEDALRAWAARPPRTPPEEAARRVAARLPDRRFTRGGTPVARVAAALVAAALVVAVALVVWLGPVRGPERRLLEDATAPPAGVPVAPSGDVLVIELDPETTLYMTLTETQGDPS